MKLLIILSLFLAPSLLFAQYAESIRTARPGQGIGAYTLGKNVLQVQSGLNLEKYENDVSDVSTNTWNTVIRLGVFERFELSGLVNLKHRLVEFDNYFYDSDWEEKSLNQVAFGARYNISKNEEIIPAIGIQSRLTFLLPSDLDPREESTLNNILVISNKITPNLSFMTNWLLIVPGSEPQMRTAYVANLSYSFTDKLGTFVEIYGDLGESPNLNYDGGFSFLVNNDLQLDVSAGYQGTNLFPEYFIDFGVSWRIDWRE